MVRIFVTPRGSVRGSDHFLVVDATGREATLVRVDPDGTLEARLLGSDERPPFRRSFERDARIGAGWLVKEAQP